MQTEFDQQRQTEDALTNVQAATPFALNPNSGTTYPSFWKNDDVWKEAAKSKNLVNPPSPKEINKQMWIGSFMTALMVGLTSKDPASAIAGGLWGAIAIHDHGNALRQRAESVPQLLKEGYSAHAVRRWYDTGQEDGLNKERDDMLARDKFNEQNRDDERNHEYRKERDQANDAYRTATTQQRERFQNATLGFRRQTLDFRRQQVAATMAQSQLAERQGGLPLRQMAQSVLQTGIDPITGKAPTAARIKEMGAWRDGNMGYAATRAGMLTQLDKVGELLSLDIANGTGLEGYAPASAFVIAGAEPQRVRSLIENLRAGQFMANVQNLRGLGALSEAEGARVQNLIATLDPTLGEDELRRQLGEVQQIIIDGLERLDDSAVFNQWDIPEAQREISQPAPAETPKNEPPKEGKNTASNGVTYEVTYK